MQRNEPVLTIRARTHFGGAADEDTHLTGADFREQLLLPRLRIGFMDVGDFFRRDVFFRQLLFQIVIDIERTIAFRRRQWR